VLATPLRVDGKPIGALEVYSNTPPMDQPPLPIIEWAAANAPGLEMARFAGQLRAMKPSFELSSKTSRRLFVTDLHGQLLHCNRAAFGDARARNPESGKAVSRTDQPLRVCAPSTAKRCGA